MFVDSTHKGLILLFQLLYSSEDILLYTYTWIKDFVLLHIHVNDKWLTLTN